MTSVLTPERRASLYFLSQFMAGGTANAYAGIWFAQKGLSENQIGIVNSLHIAILLTINVFVGRVADRASDWKTVIVFGAVASGLTSIGLFWADSFWPILIFFTLQSITQAMIVPVGDAAAVYMMTQLGKNTGHMRALSSTGYLIGLLASGFLIDRFGGWLFVPLFVALTILKGGAALLLPRFKINQTSEPQSQGHSFVRFLKPDFLAPLAGWAIVYATHVVLNGFQSLLWSNEGYSPAMISILIGIGGLSETIAFFLFKRVAGSLDPRWIILASGAVTVLRWIAMAQSPSLAFLMPLQLLHGITFALGLMACITHIGKSTSVGIAAEAQSFFLVLQQVSAIVVITLFGWLAGEHGSGAYWGLALFAGAGTALIVVSFSFRKAP